MRLWTLQTNQYIHAQRERGVLRADACHWEDFRDAYAWLAEQMRLRIGSGPADWPIWAWPKRPDLRNKGRGYPGERMILLEFEAPDDKVLVTPFDEWHCVLNSCYLPRDDEQDSWESWPEDLESVRQSWQRLFDPKYHSDGSLLQATLWEVPWTWIRREKEFTAR